MLLFALACTRATPTVDPPTPPPGVEVLPTPAEPVAPAVPEEDALVE